MKQQNHDDLAAILKAEPGNYSGDNIVHKAVCAEVARQMAAYFCGIDVKFDRARFLRRAGVKP